MCADLDDARAVEDDDEIGHAHRAEAVRHEEGDAAVGGGPIRGGGVALEQRVLGFGVERGGGLVEHEQQRVIAHEAACQRELLPLTERDLDPAGPRGAELGLQPRGQARGTLLMGIDAGALRGYHGADTPTP
jgi:hypothetical protein